MLVVVAVSIVQVALYVYVRSVAVSAAREGARRAAALGAGPDEATTVARRELDRAPGLTGGAEVSSHIEGADVVVRAQARVRGIGFVPDLGIDVEARARDEHSWVDAR